MNNKLFVAGSRTFIDKNFIWNILNSIKGRYKISKFISGGAIGVDSISEEWARKNLVGFNGFTIDDLIIIKPEWDKYGKYEAPKIRNEIMVKMLDPYVDVACVFLDKFSNTGGTRHSIDMLKKYKVQDILYFRG